MVVRIHPPQLMDLPYIKNTYPGEEYCLKIHPDRIKDARLFASRYDLAVFCKQMVADNSVICELGPWRGHFSQKLLDIFNPAKCYLIDVTDHLGDKFANDHRVVFLHGSSWDMLATLPDASIDYIYIDADHSYNGAKKDIERAHSKVKAGGVIQFNDYSNGEPEGGHVYGVVKAANAYIENYDVRVLGLSLERSGFHDLAIMRL